MIVIGLGSNVGAREVMLESALMELRALLTDMRVSHAYETPALLLPGAPPEWDLPFLNMAAAGRCTLAPRALLTELKAIEMRLGRTDRGRWAPREIDLDILVYDDVCLSEEGLVIPHPELLRRYFALAPLVDVAPDSVIQGRRASDWLAEMNA